LDNELPQGHGRKAWIDYPVQLKRAAKNRRGLFQRMPLNFRNQVNMFKSEEMDWDVAFQRLEYANSRNSFNLSDPVENWNRASTIYQDGSSSSSGDYPNNTVLNKCSMRHPATAPCANRDFCSKVVINSNIFVRTLPNMFSQSVILSCLEFYFSICGFRFTTVNGLDHLGKLEKEQQLRIIAPVLKSAMATNEHDCDFLYGADVTIDILESVSAYTRASYVGVKNDNAFNSSTDEITCSNFFYSSHFEYLVTLAFAVDTCCDDAFFTGLEHDTNIPAEVRLSTKHSRKYPNKPNNRQDAELVTYDERCNLLIVSIQRLFIYRDSSENSHFGVLCLMRKYFNTYVEEERARIVKALEPRAAEKSILETGKLGHDESPFQRSLRIQQIDIQNRIRKDVLRSYRNCLSMLMTRLLGCYLEFMTSCGGISVKRRRECILIPRETRSDEFLAVRRTQFETLVAQSSAYSSSSFSFFTKGDASGVDEIGSAPLLVCIFRQRRS